MKKVLLTLSSVVLFTFSTFQVRADSVLTTISLGNAGSTGIAANPATNKIYVAIDNQNRPELLVMSGGFSPLHAR